MGRPSRRALARRSWASPEIVEDLGYAASAAGTVIFS